ncbi:MAG: hypothetical protein C3F12_01085 [Candidatus Methylomirabilota bacterium]|nr:hypothetical protein [candidate division NC10 bacterium]PWB48708.1 MAG: hypothetical protein C3F12_01085 [candidate division NC10 bacterium]
MPVAVLPRFLRYPAIAVDLGTAHTRVARGDRSTLELPSTVGGRSALRGGVIVNTDATVAVLKTLIRSVTNRFSRPCALACVPTDADDRERAAVLDCVSEAGAQAVLLIPEPLAAAVGAGIDVSSPYAHMVVDIGEGITDCAIIKEGRIVAARAARVGCSDLRDGVRKTIQNEWGVSVGTEEAEAVLRRIGVERTADEQELATITAFDDGTRAPVVLPIPTAPLRAALQLPFGKILTSATTLFRDIPHSWGSDIIDSGLVLSGGGSLLRGMRARIEAETGLNVSRANDPLGGVVFGARAMLPVAEVLQLWH